MIITSNKRYIRRYNQIAFRNPLSLSTSMSSSIASSQHEITQQAINMKTLCLLWTTHT